MQIRIQHTQLTKLGLAIVVAFAALAIWNLVQLVLVAHVSGQQDDLHARASSSSVRSPPTDAERILHSGLFGSHGFSVPATSLPFTLKGTYAGPAGEGYAIIADTHGKTGAYARGSLLPGNVRVMAIDAHRVLLSTPRGEESLPLLDPTHSSTGHSVDRDALPSPESGMNRGLHVTAHMPMAMVRAWHLRPGDTVTAIDGQPLANKARALGLLHMLRPGQPLKLQVLRDGRIISLDVQAPPRGIPDWMEP